MDSTKLTTTALGKLTRQQFMRFLAAVAGR